MRTKSIVTALLAVSLYVATACSKDKKECLECKAICAGTGQRS